MQSSNITLRYRMMKAIKTLMGDQSTGTTPMPNRKYIPHSATGRSKMFKKNLRRVKAQQRRRAHYRGMKRRRARV